MFSGFLSFFRPTQSAEWTLAELDVVLAAERRQNEPPARTPYPWLADVKPLPPRTGRAHLRLVVNN
jgi:hypothetical protein